MGPSPFSHNNRSWGAETSKTNHSAPSRVPLPAAPLLHKEWQHLPQGNKKKNLPILPALSQDNPIQSNCRWKLSQSWPVYFTRKPESILCKCRTDAVQEAALDLHSSSSIPSPIQRRRSQEAGSKGTGLINHHRTGIKQRAVGRGKKNKAEWCLWSDKDEEKLCWMWANVQHSNTVLRVLRNQNMQQESVDSVNIFLENLEEELMMCVGSQVLTCIWNILFLVKNGLGLLEKKRKERESAQKPEPQTRALSRGHSRRLLSHRSGTEQKFHTNYTGQAEPRCFCNCLCSPAQKIKEEKNLGP